MAFAGVSRDPVEGAGKVEGMDRSRAWTGRGRGQSRTWTVEQFRQRDHHALARIGAECAPHSSACKSFYDAP